MLFFSPLPLIFFFLGGDSFAVWISSLYFNKPVV